MNITLAQSETLKVIEKRREEQTNKAWERWFSNISAGFDKLQKDIISMVSPFGDSSRILAITTVVDESKRNFSDISDTVRVETEKADKESRISSLLANTSPTELAILKHLACIRDDWIDLYDLTLERECRCEWSQIWSAIVVAGRHGLIRRPQNMYYEDMNVMDGKAYMIQLDPDLKEALLR
jgi:hypothetical protein